MGLMQSSLPATDGPADRGKLSSNSDPLHVMQAPNCKAALISTYVPKNCGLATFTHALVQELRVSQGLPQVCRLLYDIPMPTLLSNIVGQVLVRV